MVFNFIPYRLKQNTSDLKEIIQYIDTDNGIDLYKAKIDLNSRLNGIPIVEVNLYFLEGKLITVYLHLEDNLRNNEKAVRFINEATGKEGIFSRSNFGVRYQWKGNEEVLMLIKDQIRKRMYLYYSLNQHIVL